MDLLLEKIRDTQKESWNKSSSGWKKWDDMFMSFLRPVGEEMIRMLRVSGDDYIMDVATGTGEPGLTIATLLSSGKVIGTDLAEDMLTIARENALKRGLQNFETACCDVSALPFKDESFDSICCRCGFMFFPDMEIALKEMIRVLKPGGRIVAAVWNVPEKNFWISASMQTMIEKLQLKSPVNGAPGLFRCAQPDLMADMFKKNGLKEIEEKEIIGKL